MSIPVTSASVRRVSARATPAVPVATSRMDLGARSDDVGDHLAPPAAVLSEGQQLFEEVVVTRQPPEQVLGEPVGIDGRCLHGTSSNLTVQCRRAWENSDDRSAVRRTRRRIGTRREHRRARLGPRRRASRTRRQGGVPARQSLRRPHRATRSTAAARTESRHARARPASVT